MANEFVIPNPQDLELKKQKIRKQGLRKLQVISDFDKTLTKAFVNGEYVLSLIAYLRNKKYLTEDYAPKAFALYEKYHPYEISLTLPRKEKEKAMQLWWKEHFALLIQSGLNKETIQKAASAMVEEHDILFREGTPAFFSTLKEKKIPLVIMSASLGDLLQELLAQNNYFSSNITVISNLLDFDTEGKAKKVKGTIIHSLNKREAAVKRLPIYKKLQTRKNIILLGDALEDLDMIYGVKYENLIKIGFLNEQENELLPVYKKYFDMIILKDGEMTNVNNLLNDVLSKTKTFP